MLEVSNSLAYLSPSQENGEKVLDPLPCLVLVARLLKLTHLLAVAYVLKSLGTRLGLSIQSSSSNVSLIDTALRIVQAYR